MKLLHLEINTRMNYYRLTTQFLTTYNFCTSKSSESRHNFSYCNIKQNGFLGCVNLNHGFKPEMVTNSWNLFQRFYLNESYLETYKWFFLSNFSLRISPMSGSSKKQVFTSLDETVVREFYWLPRWMQILATNTYRRHDLV